MSGECERCGEHPVDWRSRALAAEGRLRTVERCGREEFTVVECPHGEFWRVGGEIEEDELVDAIDAWAAANPEETP